MPPQGANYVCEDGQDSGGWAQPAALREQVRSALQKFDSEDKFDNTFEEIEKLLELDASSVALRPSDAPHPRTRTLSQSRPRGVGKDDAGAAK